MKSAMKSEYVIDSNVLFSAFISGKDVYRLLFSEYNIYIPDFAFSEIEKYKTRILRKTKLKEQEFRDFVVKLLHYVNVVPNLLISQDSLNQAHKLCQSIDEKDTVYVATAIEFQFILVTNDISLYNGLKNRNFNQVILLEDIIKQIPSMKDLGTDISTN
jgi:predicted nucleic acid-binding protein